MSDFQFKVLYGDSDIVDGDFAVDLDRNLLGQAFVALTNINKTFLDRIRERLSRPGSGRIYPSKWGGNRKHQASRPGEPPAPDLGLYKDSFEDEIETTSDSVIARVTSSLWNVMGRRLELGGQGGGVYIAPRPHIRPVLDQIEPLIDGESS